MLLYNKLNKEQRMSRLIIPVSDNLDKKNTYTQYARRYNIALKNEFYFEAMLITYAMMEDRLRSWLYYLGCLDNKGSRDFDCKSCKKEIRFMFDNNDSSKFRFPVIGNISGKRAILEATLKWADSGYENSENSKYLTAVKKYYEKKLNIHEVMEQFDKMEKWCSYRNEVIHALMNKNVESVNAELAERVVEGMAIARYFDNLVKRIKTNSGIRKSINLK